MANKGLNALRRLQAFKEGRPQPVGDSLLSHVADPEHVAAVAFVRMGGEARPWAVGVWPEIADDPFIRSVPDGRQADPIGEMLAEFSHELGVFLDSPVFGGSSDDLALVSESPLTQVWLPNRSHIDMLHMLNLRYTFARGGEGADPERTAALQALGRLCGYLFRESGCAGEVGVIDATAFLNDAFTFPVDDLRAAHLGLLMAMLEETGGREDVMQAGEEAEALAVSTSLDPAVERDDLDDLVKEFNKDGEKAAYEQIEQLLSAEIKRRLSLTLDAVRVLREDPRPVNPGTEPLVKTSAKTRWYEYLRTEAEVAQGGEARAASAETDKKRDGAAKRYVRYAAANDRRDELLREHDAALVDEAVAAGDAIRGRIVEIDEKVPPNMKQKRPFWIVELPVEALLRLKPPKDVGVFEIEAPKGHFIGIQEDDGRRLVQIWFTDSKSIEKPVDPGFIGEVFSLVPVPADFSGLRMAAINRAPGAGAWLARGEGGPPPAAGDSEDPSSLLEEVEGLRA